MTKFCRICGVKINNSIIHGKPRFDIRVCDNGICKAILELQEEIKEFVKHRFIQKKKGKKIIIIFQLFRKFEFLILENF